MVQLFIAVSITLVVVRPHYFLILFRLSVGESRVDDTRPIYIECIYVSDNLLHLKHNANFALYLSFSRLQQCDGSIANNDVISHVFSSNNDWMNGWIYGNKKDVCLIYPCSILRMEQPCPKHLDGQRYSIPYTIWNLNLKYDHYRINSDGLFSNWL